MTEIAPKNLGGRPQYEPTAKDRSMVEAMASVGISHVAIAKIMNISDTTLRKHFREELDNAESKANAKVAGHLFRQATKDDPKSIPAAIFWCKTRMRWSEKHDIELTGKDGGAIKTEVTIDASDAFSELAKALDSAGRAKAAGPSEAE